MSFTQYFSHTKYVCFLFLLLKDCCAATCSEPICGAENLLEAFGVAVNISGDGFPDCKDPSMIPITIHVQDFVSSVEPQFFLSKLKRTMVLMLILERI